MGTGVALWEAVDWRKAVALCSSTIVLSSRIASSTASAGLDRLILPDMGRSGRTRSERDLWCPFLGSGLLVLEELRDVCGRIGSVCVGSEIM